MFMTITLQTEPSSRRRLSLYCPKSISGISYCAELIISGDGRFLYSSNRGHDTISAFTISKETGRLEVLGYFDCGGKGPRHICFGIREEAIVVANKDSNELCVIERNKESGHLGKVCSRQNVPAAACVVLKDGTVNENNDRCERENDETSKDCLCVLKNTGPVHCGGDGWGRCGSACDRSGTLCV
ncbi:MAG: lactonase family protein [Enterocloster sp.]